MQRGGGKGGRGGRGGGAPKQKVKQPNYQYHGSMYATAQSQLRKECFLSRISSKPIITYLKYENNIIKALVDGCEIVLDYVELTQEIDTTNAKEANFHLFITTNSNPKQYQRTQCPLSIEFSGKITTGYDLNKSKAEHSKDHMLSKSTTPEIVKQSQREQQQQYQNNKNYLMDLIQESKNKPKPSIFLENQPNKTTTQKSSSFSSYFNHPYAFTITIATGIAIVSAITLTLYSRISTKKDDQITNKEKIEENDKSDNENKSNNIENE